jgi:glycosyltransferase involved in cell wall biosynthesis/Tfp pilus assembly protein PilF/SAM-dependent methyltransferase
LLGGGHFGRFMPYSPLTSSVALPLDCFDCNWRCKHKRAHCIKDVSPGLLTEAIRQTLDQGSPRPRVFIQLEKSWNFGKSLPAWQHPGHLLSGQDVNFIEVACVSHIPVRPPAPAPATERVPCPACGSRLATTVRKSADIVQCLDCAMVYLRTRKTVVAMRALYQSYADEGSHMQLPKSQADAEGSGLKRDYFFQEILQFVKPEGGILDVGCGWGAFLLNARKHGFSPRGIELTKACVNYANSQLQIPVIDTQLAETEIPPASLQVVTMNHVFEHLPDLRGSLKKIVDSLAPGGMFCGIVPNFASFCSETLGEDWYWLDPNYHYQHFTPATLRKILENSGFVVERIYTATGDYGAENVLKACQKADAKFNEETYFQTELKKFEAAGRGEEIRFFARKPVAPANPDPAVPVSEECLLIPPLPQGPEPVVSVIVATYNAEILIRPCLENLVRQTMFDRCEILLIDNGSQQNERAIVLEFQQKHPNVRYIYTPRPSLYGAWNLGLRLARGKYWVNANTDDSMRDDALEVMTAAMEKNPECALGYCDVAWTTKPNDTLPSEHFIKTVKYPDYVPIDTLFYCITGCLQFWRTGDLRLLGGFDANIRAAGDYEPTIKLMNARMNAVHVPEVMSFFYQNRTGLTQGSTRSAEEHVEIMNRYRAGLDIANVFQTEPGNPASEATGLAQLGVHAMKFSVPWEDTPVEHVDFAFECFHQALEMDPENLTAGMNVVALNYKLNRLNQSEAELVRRWPKMREWIARFRAGEETPPLTLKHAVRGPAYRPADWAHRPTADQLAREPKALHPWITRIDGRHVYLSEELFPRPAGLRYQPQELDAAAKRLVTLLAELPEFYAHFGGAGDALLLLASFYDEKPDAVVFSHPNGTGAARASFDAFPKLSKIYFLPQHTEPFFHIILRYAVYELRNCLGAGTTPRFGYDEEWKASLDIVKKYRVKKTPRWASHFRKNGNSKRVAVAPKGSLSGMVGSKRNIILPEQWPLVVAHILESGFEPVILGTPNEAANYPALPGCTDARKESFPGQMRVIGECAGLVGADSWAKSFSALAEIPTLVFEPIKGADLSAWKDPSDWVFIEPWPAIKMISSLDDFRRQFDILIAKKTHLAEKNSKPVLVWEGSFLDYGSLSHINRELTARMPEVACVGPKTLPERAKNDADMKRCAGKLSSVAPKNAAVTVRHQWPPNWSRPASGALVVIQPWEYGSVPAAWVEQSANVDEFWVPSPLVRSMYVNSGIAPQKVRVVPNGVDTKKFRPNVAPLKLQTKKKFKFLFVGGTIYRKGPDVLLEAFAQTFTAKDDVCLVIKDFGGDSFYQGQTAEKAIQEIQKRPDAPEILYLNTELSSEQMPALYAACDCLVLPYRGEGFGMPVLEAMSCGRPVIVTANGATDYFVTLECGWEIPSQGVYIGDRVGDIQLAKKGWLFEPVKAELAKIMKFTAANPQECRRRGTAGRGIVERKFDWNDVAAEVAHRLRELGEKYAPAITTLEVKEKKVAPQKIVILPAVAKIGRLDEARELLAQKKFEAAWNAGIAAIAQRPFHPEAYLLLAETAKAAGDTNCARRCAERALKLTPSFEGAKHFLKQKSGASKNLGWQLPATGNPRISVCLITKNEEKFLAQCLKSVRGFASQIIVADTGSTDRTVEVAKEFGAEIYSFPWCDDFAAARNAAIEHANGDWIFILDADEELPAAQHARLLEDINNSTMLGFRLPLVNHGQENEGRSFIPRLFRNAPGVFFHGRIHEQVFPSLLPLCKKFGMQTALGTAEILHHGYTKEVIRDRNKVERNLHLLKQAVLENPADANLLMNLGLELVRSEKLHDGIAQYRAAFELMSAQPANEIVPELREALLTQFTTHLYKVRGHDEVIQVLTSPLAKEGMTASLHLALGLSLFESKQWAAAAEQMDECLAKKSQPALTPVNVDIFSAAPWHCLALCRTRMSDMAGAEKAFQSAIAEPVRNEEARMDYAKFLRQQNRPVDAMHQLNEVVARNPHSANAWKSGGEIVLGHPEFLEFARDWTGEAIKHLPTHPVVVAQRAEVLLLSGETAEALGLWQTVWEVEREPRSLAALILCEMAGASATHVPDEGTERATSLAFIEWYRRLISMRAGDVVARLNGNMEKVALTLPTAAEMIGNALAEAGVGA